MSSTGTATKFKAPQRFADYLETVYAGAHATSVLVRDRRGRPWITTWDDGGEPFVISYPEGDENGMAPDARTWHGSLNLPAYPVRIIKETTND